MPTSEDLFAVQMILDGSEICEPLGNSLLGSTYRVVHPDLGNCALKFFSDFAGKNKTFLEYFFKKIKKADELNIPHLVKIHRTRLEKQVFILRDLVVGKPLGYLINQGPLSVGEATRIAAEVSLALCLSANQDFVFRNLKPNNIILLPNKNIRIVDYSLPPTDPHYIAPEQCQKQKSTHRSDIYTLGCIYYQMLSAQRVFNGRSTEEIMDKHQNEPVDWSVISPLEPKCLDILKKMLTKNPEDRYASAHIIIHELNQVLEKLGLPFQKFTASSPITSPFSATKTSRPMHTGMMMTVKREKRNKEPEGEGSNTMKMLSLKKQHELAIERKKEGEKNALYFQEADFFHAENVLEKITEMPVFDNQREMNVNRRVYFPRSQEKVVIQHLQKTFRRECWLLKDSEYPDELEVDIDLEQGCRLKHFYHYEDILQKALEGYKKQQKQILQAKTQQGIQDTVYSHQKDLPGETQARGNLQATVTIEEEDFPQVVEEDKSSGNLQETVTIGEEDLPQIVEEDKSSGNLQETATIKEEDLPQIVEEDKSLEETLDIESIDDLPQVVEKDKSLEETLDIESIDDLPLVVDEKKSENEEDTLNVNDFNELPEGEDKSSTVSLITDALSEPIDTEEKPKFPQKIEVRVDFTNTYQTKGWLQFIRQHQLKKGQHYEVSEEDNEQPVTVTIFLNKLDQYDRVHQHISHIKSFFDADYEISEIDRGGMGAILKLTSKNEGTILSLRPENKWARQYFSPYLKVRQIRKNKEVVYAELPADTHFVVKVAFRGYEEALIQEAHTLGMVAEDPLACENIVGSVQQGRLFSQEDEDQEQIGYYLMLEYISNGDAEELYQEFPEGKIPPTTCVAIMLDLVTSLQHLKAKGIIHRDIKPQNIMFDEKSNPKLCDFGLAITTNQMSEELTDDRIRLLRVIDQEFLKTSHEREQVEQKLEKNNNEVLKEQLTRLRAQEKDRAKALKNRYRPISAEENATRGKFEGSLYYAAPEQFNMDVVLNHACDIYQLGAVMYTLLTGKPPVEAENTMDIISQVTYPVKSAVSDHLKPTPLIEDLSNLIQAMRAHQPEERFNIDEAKKQLQDIIQKHSIELKKPISLDDPLANKFHQRALFKLFPLKPNQKIVFHCRHCRKKLHIYQHMDNQKGKCPGCKKDIWVKIQYPETL